MKKVSFGLFVFISILLWSGLATPQEKSPHIGVGISIGKEVYGWGMATIDFPSVYIPIFVSKNFRLEPEIGLWWQSYSDSYYYSESDILFRIGWGMFLVKQKERTNLYQGLRVGLILEDNGDSRKYFSIGPALGGEYFFSSHFSLGGEAQLNFTTYGDGGSFRSGSCKTVVFVRWYF